MSKDDVDGLLWDIIVITTFDENQKQFFELMINELLTDPLIKKKCFIIADPPNVKLGSGGSTLYSLQCLIKKFGKSVYSKKILIIHSGGSSQRLPSHSIQGKIFSPLPFKVPGSSSFSKIKLMFDMKISMYLPFAEILQPGVFVTCADDIETFFFNKDLIDETELMKADVVALGHPCDLQTATGHGVYVLPEDTLSSSEKVILSDCLEVLQKPSLKLMTEKNAICRTKWSHDEMVYSDSVFWLSERVYRALLTWYSTNGFLSCELDAYAHILPCFGSNIKSMPSDSGYKAKLFPILTDFNFKVIVLNKSKFYHLGTMTEYLNHFTVYDRFINELQLITNTSDVDAPVSKNSIAKWRIMYSHLYSNHLINLDEGVLFVAEFCRIGIPLHIMGNTILSNCTIKGLDDNISHIEIPGGFLFHTAPVKLNKKTLYVTIAFEIKADMKRIMISVDEIRICGVELNQILTPEHLIKCSTSIPCSFFALPLFQASSSPEDSFFSTLSLIKRTKVRKIGSDYQSTKAVIEEPKPLPYFSMTDILVKKDIETFFRDRKRLFDLIKDSSNLIKRTLNI